MGHELEWETTVDLYGELFNENVPALFLIVVDTYDLEPYSWGQSRGVEHEFTAYLKSIKFGEKVFSRQDAIEMYGFPAVERVENEASERYAEVYER